MLIRYDDYERLRFERRCEGVLLITIDRPERLNATDERLHSELSQVWRDVARDRETAAVVVTGTGKAFSAGGDLEMVERMRGDYRRVAAMAGEAAEIAGGPLQAARWTKRTLNHWLRSAIPAFDASVAYEILSFMGEDVREGAGALKERRAPRFES